MNRFGPTSRGYSAKPENYFRAGICFFLFVLCGNLCGQTQSPYETARPGYAYQFPGDHFNHPGYQTEWWYYTGNVVAEDGRRFGFELTFFRQGIARRAAPDPATSPWDVNELFLAHLALSDLDGKNFLHTE